MSDAVLQLRYEANQSFVQILETVGCSLAISIYKQNRVLLVCAAKGALRIDSFAFDRPMGIATTTADGATHMAVATFQEMLILADAPLLARGLPEEPGRYEHLLMPRASLYSGDLDAHDLVWLGGRLLTANTRFSCIAEVDARYSFVPVWAPPFITQMMPEDRCHLNGLAAADGHIVYATAFSPTDNARGWRERRMMDGLLMEVPSGKAVLSNLCMPHSPRVFDGDLYVLDSGHGRVLRVAPAEGRGETLATLPGFARGLDSLGDILFVGLSRLRPREGALPPVAESKEPLVCGVAAIERKQGRTLGYLRFDESFEEIFDVKVLPKFRYGGMLGSDDGRHRRALVLPGRAFWGEPRPANKGS